MQKHFNNRSVANLVFKCTIQNAHVNSQTRWATICAIRTSTLPAWRQSFFSSSSSTRHII